MSSPGGSVQRRELEKKVPPSHLASSSPRCLIPGGLHLTGTLEPYLIGKCSLLTGTMLVREVPKSVQSEEYNGLIKRPVLHYEITSSLVATAHWSSVPLITLRLVSY